MTTPSRFSQIQSSQSFPSSLRLSKSGGSCFLCFRHKHRNTHLCVFLFSSSLAVNLIARGDGKLDVARQLVGKSFAAWEERKAQEGVSLVPATGLDDVVQASNQEDFMNMLVETLGRRQEKYDDADLKRLLDILTNRESLKKTSKSYISFSKSLEKERITLKYLEQEAEQLEKRDDQEPSDYTTLLEEDVVAIANQVKIQQKRTEEAAEAVQYHAFAAIADAAQGILAEDSSEGANLRAALASARGVDDDRTLSANDLTAFAKSALVVSRKTRKLAKDYPGFNPASIIQTRNCNTSDGSWDGMLAITRTLLSYGCLTSDFDDLGDYEAARFSITSAGMNVGMLGFENSLWALVAIGGAWPVPDDPLISAGVEESEAWDGDREVETIHEQAIKPRIEAEQLVSHLCEMDPAEFAGYISAIVAESSRSQNGPEVLELYRELTAAQQRVVQGALESLDRLMEVQLMYSVDSGARMCNFDISFVSVVTAWANGCSWNEALSLSGLPPGDLVRTLSRVLDAVRQLGNLPYEPIRKGDFGVGGQRVSLGIHPQVRRLCREAAIAIDRYPVKDPMSFETSVDPEANGMEGDEID